MKKLNVVLNNVPALSLGVKRNEPQCVLALKFFYELWKV